MTAPVRILVTGSRSWTDRNAVTAELARALGRSHPRKDSLMPTYSHNAADGYAITLDDLAAFVAEMRGYRELPGTTQVRFSQIIEFDLVNGPRANRVTADPDAARPNREQRRAQGQRGPRG